MGGGLERLALRHCGGSPGLQLLRFFSRVEAVRNCACVFLVFEEGPELCLTIFGVIWNVVCEYVSVLLFSFSLL